MFLTLLHSENFVFHTLTIHQDGLNGTGKTMSLCHAIHYCYTQGWLVLHIPDGEEKRSYTETSVCAEVQAVYDLIAVPLTDNTAHIWVKNCKELLPSSYNTSRFDQPLQAVEWLRNFRITNEHFLSEVCAPLHAG